MKWEFCKENSSNAEERNNFFKPKQCNTILQQAKTNKTECDRKLRNAKISNNEF